ncbi:alpha/beta fold hydrolase [Cellulomonas sp.]|uniref:alpha/beta hydrolase family protein n=1 Tax=Cellulomonas sp. TaxID=40001 RepID=UPI00258B016A|nr:alpha/beta fold hydrolase [Cellulomonas sp.]MCR6689126.1 alpha/beta hydrolase [Cellulomonas sp.]
MRRAIVRVLVVVAVLVTVLTVATVAGNDFRLTTAEVSIPGPQGTLAGVVAQPEEGGARGLVVMIHGDGPVEATQDGLYTPWFEAAADAGFATLSWSKPGVGGSQGSWLEQSMADRAAEVEAVLDWARTQPDLPAGPVVLWAASQGGWVFPRVVADRPEVAAVVAVGTAVDWRRQGRFHLLAGLADRGADAAQTAREVAESDRVLALLERVAPYDEYARSTTDPMPADRWGFVLRNFRADATPELHAVAERGVPVHLMVGSHDRNVDVAETERVYRAALGDLLSVATFDAPHTLARPVVEDVAAVGVLTAVVRPRALLAPGVLDDYREWLRDVG